MKDPKIKQALIEKIINAEWEIIDRQTTFHEEGRSFPLSGACYTPGSTTIERYLLRATPDTKGKNGVAALAIRHYYVSGHWQGDRFRESSNVTVQYGGIGGDKTLKKILKDQVERYFNNGEEIYEVAKNNGGIKRVLKKIAKRKMEEK